MTQYKTKDGQEIKVGGVYRTETEDTVECIGFRKNSPYVVCEDSEGDLISVSAGYLTSLPESPQVPTQPEYDPEQMWVLYEKPVVNSDRFHQYGIYCSHEYALSVSKTIAPFAIAPVGKKFRKGMNL